MRNSSVPALVPRATTGNVTDHVEYNAKNYPSAPVIAIEEHGSWHAMSSAVFRDAVRGVAKGLIADGIKPGDRVAIFSRTRHEWTISDYAIWYAGGVTVPIYETSSAEQVQWIMQDSNVVATFFEAQRTLYPFREIQTSVPQMQHEYIFADGGLTELTKRGVGVSDDQLDERQIGRAHV